MMINTDPTKFDTLVDTNGRMADVEYAETYEGNGTRPPDYRYRILRGQIETGWQGTQTLEGQIWACAPDGTVLGDVYTMYLIRRNWPHAPNTLRRKRTVVL